MDPKGGNKVRGGERSDSVDVFYYYYYYYYHYHHYYHYYYYHYYYYYYYYYHYYYYSIDNLLSPHTRWSQEIASR